MDNSALRSDPADYRLSRKLFGRLWCLTKPYWRDRKNWRSWVLLLIILAVTPLISQMFYIVSQYTNDATNALVDKKRDLYTSLFWWMIIFSAAWGFLMILCRYLSSIINIRWRYWLTDYLIRRYLDRRTYYDITLHEDLDNPDQRIQEQVTPFVQGITDLPVKLIGQVFQLITGGIIVASVSASLAWYVVAYSIIQTLVTVLIYTPSIRLEFDSTIAEADLRRGLLHVRENAETVALYRGENNEYCQVSSRLKRAVKRQWSVLRYSCFTMSVGELLGTIWQVAPFFLLAPLLFQGKIEYGAIAMATTSAAVMMQALTTLSTFIPTLTQMAPGAVRLAQILERFDQMDAQRSQSNGCRLTLVNADYLTLSNVSLQTPTGERQLTTSINLTVKKGERLIITGRTGAGKSSLLRAMAGLWSRGTGQILIPPADQCLFLPQKPYMILSDLRAQLLYPGGTSSIIDAKLRDVLTRVGLPDLADRHGGLNAIRDWSKVLSLGEQQRIAFARLLISGAQYVFLDEATSAVDTATEKVLYRLLQENGNTYISVGHRESILQFHDTVLELQADGTGHLFSLRDSAEVIDLDPVNG